MVLNSSSRISLLSKQVYKIYLSESRSGYTKWSPTRPQKAQYEYPMYIRPSIARSDTS